MKNWIPTNNDLSYYPLLHKAVTETKGSIVECGMGHGSTMLLNETKRKILSYETVKEWADKFDVKYKTVIAKDAWLGVMSDNLKADVIFIDQAPGEIREVCIKYLHGNFKGIIVAHDTEPAADYGYQMRQHFKSFKYVVEVKTSGAWATAMSNDIDITGWIGLTYGDYSISAYTD